MKTFLKSIITISLLSGISGIVFAQPQPQPSKPKAAVYIIGAPEGRDALRMAVNNFLIKSGMYQMIAVDAIDIVAREHNRQLSGSVSDGDIAALGLDAGARYVCVVERTDIDGVSYVASRMVSVQNKVAEFADMVELPRGERIINVIERLIYSMLGIAYEEERALAESAPAAVSQGGYSAPPPDYSGAEPARKKPVKPKRERDLSFGFGGFFDSDVGGGIAWSGSGQAVAMPYNGGGGYAYLDLIYVEAIVGLSSVSGKWKSSNATDPDDLPEMSRWHSNYGVFVKFPLIDIGESVRLYPLYGIDYDNILSADTGSPLKLKFADGSEYLFDGEDGRPSEKDWNALWFKFGIGIEGGGLRIEGLYGIRVANKFEENSVDKEKHNGRDAKANLGRGLTVRLAFSLTPRQHENDNRPPRSRLRTKRR